MKRILVVSILMVSVLASGLFAKEGVWGGFWHMGMGMCYTPQTAMNDFLTTKGYTGLSDIGPGFTLGGGGLINSVFIGGWGFFGFYSSEAVNTAAGKTLKKTQGGRGGFELGYNVVHSKNFDLIPSVHFVWGNGGYTFSTNIAFGDYIDNPVEFKPKFDTGHFSLGVGVNALIHGNHAGTMVKVVYLYTPSTKLAGVHFTDTPALGQHSVLATVEYMMGGFGTKKERKEKFDKVPYRGGPGSRRMQKFNETPTKSEVIVEKEVVEEVE